MFLWIFPFLHVFIYFIFWFLQMFSSLFIVDFIYWLHCFFTVVVVVTASATDLRQRFLLSVVFHLTVHSCFYQSFPWAGISALNVARISTEVWNLDLVICLFESHSVRQLYGLAGNSIQTCQNMLINYLWQIF